MRDARVADREREAVQRGAQLARDRVGGAARRRRRRPPARARGSGPPCRSAACRSPAIEPGAAARAARSAATSTRTRQSSSAGAKWCARTTITAAPLSSSTPSSAARATMSPRSVTWRCSTARRNASCAASDARSGARTRSTSDAISVVTSRSSAAGGSPAAAAQPQPPDDRVADAQLVRRDAGRVGHQRALVGGRARRDREHGARAVDQHERGVERPAGRADDLGQPVAGLDRVGDRAERAEVQRRRSPRTRSWRRILGARHRQSSSKYQRKPPPSITPASTNAAST